MGITYSVVVPAFNETGNLRVLCDALEDVFNPLEEVWELVFVDDGSQDSTWEIIRQLHDELPHVKGIRLSRNFGHQNALIAGLTEARGKAIICMDADMQHPPRLIAELVQHWKQGSKIVKTKRLDSARMSILKRLSSRWFYKVFAYMSGVDIDSGMADYRLFDAAVLNEILKFQEQGLFLRGLVEWVGYESSTVTYTCEPRFSGESKYTIRKMLRFAWDGITSFSLVPLRIGVSIGLLASVVAFVSTLYAILAKVVTGTAVSGWSSTLAIMSFLFGVLFLYLGLIEVRGRPRYLVSERIGNLESDRLVDAVQARVSQMDEVVSSHDAKTNG